jgi:hypothetical protein
MASVQRKALGDACFEASPRETPLTTHHSPLATHRSPLTTHLQLAAETAFVLSFETVSYLFNSSL